jgi:hypothetical protein
VRFSFFHLHEKAADAFLAKEVQKRRFLMTQRPQGIREYRNTDRALAAAERHYDKNHPQQQPALKADSDLAIEFDWLRSRTED